MKSEALQHAISIILLADTHGDLDARVLEVCESADMIVHAGDVGAGVAERLSAQGAPLYCVRGNNDPANAEWPQHEVINLPGGCLAVEHGDRLAARGRHAGLRKRFPEARAVVYGHSHKMLADTDSDPWILNPGAAGRVRTYGGPSCMRLLIDGHDWQLEMLRFELPAQPIC